MYQHLDQHVDQNVDITPHCLFNNKNLVLALLLPRSMV